VPGLTASVNFTSGDPSQPDLRTFLAPDRTVAVPNFGGVQVKVEPAATAEIRNANMRQHRVGHGKNQVQVRLRNASRPAASDRNEHWMVLLGMRLRCFLGFHRPMLKAILRRPQGYGSICEVCARPLDGRRAATGSPRRLWTGQATASSDKAVLPARPDASR
jgi:hypothetical protein